MVAGILFQLASTITYCILMSIVFFWGRREISESKPLRWLAAALVLVVMCMIARGMYRSIELLQGWTGYLNTHEAYVIGLDGSLMIFAVLGLNMCNPGRLLQMARTEMGGVKGVKEVSSEEDEAKGSLIDDSDGV
jgi:hypothetical protein